MHGLDNAANFTSFSLTAWSPDQPLKKIGEGQMLSARIDAVGHVFSNLLLEAIDLILQKTVQLRQVRLRRLNSSDSSSGLLWLGILDAWLMGVYSESVRQGHSAHRDDLIRNMTAISKIPKQKWLWSIHVSRPRLDLSLKAR